MTQRYRKPGKAYARAARWAAAFALAILSALSPVAARTKAEHYRWTPVPVVHAAPSQVFKQLGLTHITRIGSARRTWEDPGFPKELTDVVPYDTQHVLLLRGTDHGIAAYRQTIAAADLAAQEWLVNVELLRVDDDGEHSVAVVAQKTMADGPPLTVALGDGADQRTYRFKIAPATGDAIQLSCQPCFTLPTASVQEGAAGQTDATSGAPRADTAKEVADTNGSSSAASQSGAKATGGTPVPPTSLAGKSTPSGAAAVGVLTPALISVAPMSRTIKPGDATVFPDPAAARQAVLRKLGAAAVAESVDYRVRVTCTAVHEDARAPGADGGPIAQRGRVYRLVAARP
jgi:hypothetical protein